jgi:stage III sporulation protein AG
MGGAKDIKGGYAGIWEKLRKGGWAAVVLAVGAALLMIPWGNTDKAERDADANVQPEHDFSLREQEERMEGILADIYGAGRVRVMLTLSSGPEQVLQKDVTSSARGEGETPYETERSESTVIVSGGGSAQSAVAAKYLYPKYQGALVVADGAGKADIRLELMRAVSGLTGLGTDRITVAKMK